MNPNSGGFDILGLLFFKHQRGNIGFLRNKTIEELPGGFEVEPVESRCLTLGQFFGHVRV